jgi:hypothetical protein
MTNKTLGKGILVAMSLAFITAIFETSLDIYTAENLYIVSGIMILFFGTWGSIRLINS